MNEENKRKIDRAIKKSRHWVNDEARALPAGIRQILLGVADAYYGQFTQTAADARLEAKINAAPLRMFLTIEKAVRIFYRKAIAKMPARYIVRNLDIAFLDTAGDLFRDAIKQEFKAVKKARKA